MFLLAGKGSCRYFEQQFPEGIFYKAIKAGARSNFAAEAKMKKAENKKASSEEEAVQIKTPK